jgi:RNA polymerase sigma factor (TIGR02999 family)
MTIANRGEITQLLVRWSEGDRAALDLLTPVIYRELRKIAEAHLRNERNGHTLQPTALVNEAWLRLAKPNSLTFHNRKQFFGLAAHVMRQVLVDYARGTRAAKRGGADRPRPLDGVEVGAANDLDRFLVLNEAIERLSAFSPRQARVIELRYFAGLTVEEMAELLDVSPATVTREQKSAEAWLGRATEAFGA